MLSKQAVERSASVLERGEMVILPTDTVPGLFAMDTPVGEESILELKRRDPARHLARMFGSRKQVLNSVKLVNKIQRLAIQRLLPGRVTMILPSKAGKGKTLGVRLPMDSSLRALIRRTGPLIATSANISGEELRDPSALSPSLVKGVALVEEDFHPDTVTQPLSSTVIDLTTRNPLILRKGAVSVWTVGRRLEALVHLASHLVLNVLFVCGGNTCRSPMAEALLRLKCRLDRLRVKSAGLSAPLGAQAAGHALAVMRRRGIPIDNHQSKPVSAELISWADLILVMTREHLLRIRRNYVHLSDRAFLLSGFPKPWPHGKDIVDPIGGSREIYQSTLRQMQLYIDQICPVLSKTLSGAN